MIDGGDDMQGARLGVHDGRDEFWQINFGHVLTMVIFVCGSLATGATLISHFTTGWTAIQLQGQAQATQTQGLKADVAGIKSDVSDLKTQVGDMREWREHQEYESTAFKNSVSESLDEVKRHLERLDWDVGDRGAQVGGAPPPVPARNPYSRR